MAESKNPSELETLPSNPQYLRPRRISFTSRPISLQFEAPDIYSSNEPITFHSTEDLQKFAKIVHKRERRNYEFIDPESVFLETSQTPARKDSTINFRKFKFALEVPSPELKAHLIDFLERDAKSVEYLHLSIGESLKLVHFPLEVFRQFVFFACPLLQTLVLEKIPHEIATSPNLLACSESLQKLKNFVLYLQPSYADMRFLLHLFVSFPPTLEELQIFADEPALGLQIHKKVLRMLTNLQSTKRYELSNLSRLTLDFPLYGTELQAITDLNLQKLKRFIGRIVFSEDNSNIVSFFEKFGPKLEKLDLEVIFPEKNLDAFGFPPAMSKIIELQLKLTYIGDDNLNLYKMLKNFPGLKSFSLEIHQLSTLSVQMESDGNPWVNPNMTNLFFSKGITIFEDHMKNFADTFPELEKLQLTADDKIANVIFGKLKKLKDLTILGVAGLTDESFSGITWQSLKSLEKNLSKPNSSEISPENQVFFRKNADFIGNLKELTFLSIIDGSKTSITDLSILFGISHLQKLLTLNLDFGVCEHWTTTPICCISDRSIQSIGKHLVLLKNFALDSKLVSRQAMTALSNERPRLGIYHIGKDKENGIAFRKIKMPDLQCEECSKELGKHCFPEPYLPKRSIIEVNRKQSLIHEKPRWWRKKIFIISFGIFFVAVLGILIFVMTL